MIFSRAVPDISDRFPQRMSPFSLARFSVVDSVLLAGKVGVALVKQGRRVAQAADCHDWKLGPLGGPGAREQNPM